MVADIGNRSSSKQKAGGKILVRDTVMHGNKVE